MTSSAADDLRTAIAREEARLASLDDARRQAEGRLVALRAQLPASEAPGAHRALPLLPDSARPGSSAEKVALFRQLFRGRDDLSRSSGPTPRRPKGERAGMRE